MESLNKLYIKSCGLKCESYKKISNNITLINNFFEDFEEAKKFFINREKWKCIAYQNSSQPGHTSLFPKWVGKSLMEKYVLDNKISGDMNLYDIECNYFYNQSGYVWSLSNSTYFPHIDDVEREDVLGQICLINLNKVPISTKFYTYKNKEYCSSKIEGEWNKYEKNLETRLRDYYNKDNITQGEVKLFLDNQKLDIKLIKTLEYKPNQAIIYPASLFHSGNITEEFDEDNPRCLLRIMFYIKIIKPKNINYG